MSTKEKNMDARIAFGNSLSEKRTIIPFKDKFDNSLMLYALMTSKPDEVEKRKKLGIGERDD